MYNTLYYRPGVIDGHCGCGGYNYYGYPGPKRKEQRRLDATQIEVHTDEFVGENCFERGPCCEPVPVKVEESVKSFIIKAATECLEPGTLYTLTVDHPLPEGIFAQPTFIRVEKCGLFQEPVKLVYTKTIFPMCEFDGYPKCDIPVNPAFPNDGVMCCEDGINEHDGNYGPLVMPERYRHNRHNETRLIPVELDLLGNTAFGYNFVHGIGPHTKTVQLFYTNRGTFTLVRGPRRRTDY